MNKLLSVLLAALLGACGGVEDVRNPDHHIRTVITRLHADGTETTETIIGELHRDLTDYDTDIEYGDGPAGEDLEGGIGRSKQAFSYGTNSRYGLYSADTPSDGRCPNSWSSPNYCSVAGTKTLSFQNYIPSEVFGGNPDGIADVHARVEAQQAWSYMSKGGFSNSQNVGLEGGGDPNAWIDVNDGLCGGGSNVLACHSATYGSIFTSGGKRFQKGVRAAQWGWTPISAYAAINLEPTRIHNYIQANCGTAAFRANYVQNLIEHETGHDMSLAHNPSSGTMQQGLPLPSGCYDPGTTLTSAEISALSAYSP